MNITKYLKINPLYMVLGFFMAVMHSTMTRDGLSFIDKYFDIRWFSKESWLNKHEWLLFGYKVFHIWPFIVISDFFHLAHGLFVLGICLIAPKAEKYNFWQICISFFIYSFVFEVFYSTIFNIR